jgi:endoglucanase
MQGAGNSTTSYITLSNRATGLYIDGVGRTTNGAACGQWNYSGSNNQQWALEPVGSYVKLKNRATGLYLDGMGTTTNGSVAGQWCSSSNNQQWTIENSGGYSRLKNRATGLYIDGMGATIVLVDLTGRQLEVLNPEDIRSEQTLGSSLGSGLYILQVNGHQQRKHIFKVFKK